MDDYAGRVLADRYRLPLAPFGEDGDGDGDGDGGAYGPVETRAFDTYSGQEVMVRQILLPETVEAEVVGGEDTHRPYGYADPGASADPAVRRAVEAVQAVARIPDHPRLDQVFDVFTEDGSLWIVSELIAARPLAALVRDEPLSPYRAAEIASDVLTALRALHAHGWTHRNVTARTVLVCDDGRIVLSGLAAGAAEEALCGYAPVPLPDDEGAPAPDTGDGPYGEGYGTGRAEPHAHGPDGRSGDPYGDEYAGDGAYDAYDGDGAYDGDDTYDDGTEVLTGRVRAHGEDDPYDGGPYDDDPYDDGRADPYGSPRTAPPLPPGPPALPSGYEPHYVAQAADRIADDHGDDEDDEDGAAARYGSHDPYGAHGARAPYDPYGSRDPYGPDDAHGDGEEDAHGRDDAHGEDRPPRALLTGTWRDGPVPAGGGSSPYGDVAPYGGARAGLRADSRRGTRPPHVPSEPDAGRDPAGPEEEPAAAVYRGPATPLAAERARQARIAVVGAVTERWAPEQAGPVYGTWRLAPPIGPATDLWALGALLYRVLQGHAPYPEDSAAELVQMVCSEPPAFAEECGPLRPVVESLLRQDPTERPEFEELRGWLRSLVRSAPEPGAGAAVVPMPSDGAARLPIIRRRGDLVRRRRTRTRTPAAPAPAAPAPARHRRGKAAAPRSGGSPRALGRTLVLLVLLGLGAAVVYAVAFMPKAETRAGSQQPTGTVRPTASVPPEQAPPGPAQTPPQTPPAGGSAPSSNAGTPTAPALPEGYVVREDPEGFRVGVDRTWRRSPINDIGQVRYSDGDYTLIVVPGRDTVRTAGADPLEYQRSKERELQPWRDSTWSTATGLRRVDTGRQATAEGQFTWQDANGRQVYVRNLVLLVGDRYHVVQVIGPEAERDKVTEIYEQAARAYQVTR
ncbi:MULTISPECIES: protein kinase [Streptomyces]|uniref:Protein kinase n=1 Tax=Streptomyces sudanensis TaxID=436397 RepID=A0ABY4T9K4_9ACTN|nr:MULTISPECIES: protein kinase [Streptomyces]URN15367.1 protein kinase [Streptomyces sudanensis]